MMLSLELIGLGEVLDVFGNMDIPGRLAMLIDQIINESTRFAASLTPVDTGAMRDSWMGERGRMFINPSAYNPRSGAPVTDYASIVSDRCGIMDAVFENAIRLVTDKVEVVYGIQS